MRLVVNGLEQEVVYDAHAIEDLLVPLITGWIAATDDGARHWAFLAAAPGTGKSTLLQLVEQAVGPGLQCLGMDGFHFPQAYLDSTTFTASDGSTQPLASIKGAPETFDVVGLDQRLAAASGEDVGWPAYDRQLHDVVADADTVTAKHVLLEGNWLLLDDPAWSPLRRHADLTIFLRAPESVLRERLVSRKRQGGLTRQTAEEFYRRSDGPNIQRALTGSDLSGIDLLLEMAPDGTFHETRSESGHSAGE